MIFVEALLYAVSSAVLAAIALALAGGGLTHAVAGVALAIGAVVAGWTLVSGRGRPLRFRELNWWEWAIAAFYTLFALRAFLWLVFFDGDSVKVLSPNNLGDLSLHLTYIREMAGGGPFWPENPIVSGAQLTYPVGVDLLHSLLVLVGADIWRVFIWMGLIGALCTALALWRWGGAFAVAGFLCNGGLAGFAFFTTWKIADFQSELAWKSFPLALLVTQRGLLYALPAGLLLLCSWRARFFTAQEVGDDPEETRRGLLPAWGEWLLYASMPVFHVHTFLFLSFLLLSWFIVQPHARRGLAIFVASAFLPATWLTLLVTASFHGPSVLGWQPGWMQSEPDFVDACLKHLGTNAPIATIPIFWLINFGILPLVLLLLVAGPLLQEPRLVWARAVVFPALGIFLLCCFVKFAPWEWDNTKLMIWSYLAVLPFLWQHVLQRWPKPVAGGCCFLLFWSGAISLIGGIDGSHEGYTIASREELDEIQEALRDVPQSARFIANPDYNHPLVLLGRKIALGYTGHVASHGYPWREPLMAEEAALDGAPDWLELAAQLHATHLFFGTREREAFPDSKQSWKNAATLVASGSWGEIYRLPPAGSVAVPSVPPAPP